MSFGDSTNFGLDQAIQSVKDAAGFVTTARNNKGIPNYPYEDSGIDSRFFPFIAIDANRWDQLYPYRLLVIDSKNNLIVSKNNGKLFVPEITVSQGTGTSTLTFSSNPGWVFNLPITPQQLSITDQYAINTTATLRGILEEHGGLKFKMINAQGTLGVWNQRSSVSKPSTTPGILQSVFGGTIEALGNVIGQVNSVINTATGGSPANKPVSMRPETSDAGPISTGYYQAIAMQQFLEQYAEAKKDPANASWRLVFDIPKQNQSLIVTPMQFTWQQNANKPLEIDFSFQFKAWRRVDLQQTPSSVPANNQPISPGILQRILNTIGAAQQACAASINLIGAVRSDVETPLNVLRQLSLFVKGLAGVVTTAADLPSQLQKDYASSIAASMAILSNSISSTNSDPAVRSALSAVVASTTLREGLTLNAVAGGQLGAGAAMAQTLDPANNIFVSPESNFTLFAQVPIYSLALNDAQSKAVSTIIYNASQTTVDDVKKMRAVIQQLALQLSNSFGTGSAEYSKVYSQPPPTPRIQPITLDEYDFLKSLYDVMQSCDILTATTQIDDNNKQTNMDYVAGLADLAGIPFQTSSSKVLQPVPFGLTIEQIAYRYLGDAQRWIEIATLNNLRDPYIDENGFKNALLSNATGRQITIASIDNLYIGQRVVLMSATQIPSARTILGIDRLSDTSFLLTLDGLPNLDNFLLADAAYLQAYLPGTVNSQQKIFIPSNLPVPNDSTIIPPASTSNDPLTGLSKVDWLLTDKGDLAVNNYGDFRYSSGITNIKQALKIKFGTKINTVLTHPTFGLSIQPGVISSDLKIQDLYNSINTMITQDPRFQGVSTLQIVQTGPTLTINLGVTIPGQTGVFPITFSLTP